MLDKIHRYTQIHQHSPKVYSIYDLSKMAAEIKPQKYERLTEFPTPQPDKMEIINKLYKEAEQVVKSKFFRTKKLNDYVKSRKYKAVETAMAQWEFARLYFFEDQKKTEEEKNKEYELLAEQQKRDIAEQINADEQYIKREIEKIIRSNELPFRLQMKYKIDMQSKSVVLDIAMPGIECIPDTYQVYSRNHLVERKRKQIDVKYNYFQFAFSVAVYLSSMVFAICPKIKTIILSESTVHQNKKGEFSNDYILSIRFNRDKFETEEYKEREAQSFCMEFESRYKDTATFIMKPIQPIKLTNEE